MEPWGIVIVIGIVIVTVIVIVIVIVISIYNVGGIVINGETLFGGNYLHIEREGARN